MKLLLFSDVHCSQPAMARIVKRAPAVDVLVGAGDFGMMRQGTEATLAPLAQVVQPTVLVPGNAESAEELAASAPWDHVHSLHGDALTIEAVPFFGFGGAVPITPFGSWSYDFSEEDCAAALEACPENAVLVVHSPPHGVLDQSSRGQHLGSTAIRETIERTRPQLVVCGHIHDCGGRVAWLDDVPVVNAGPEGILWDLTQRQELA